MSMKYTNLPDLDTAPDLYETPDVVPATTLSPPLSDAEDDIDHDGVVKERIRPEIAQKRFLSKTDNTTERSTSSRLLPNAAVYSLNDDATKEDAVTRLRRLMLEVDELRGELTAKPAAQDGTKEPSKTYNPSKLLKIANGLKEELATLELGLEKNGTSETTTGAKSLATHIESLKIRSSDSHVPQETPKDETKVTFELYSLPSSSTTSLSGLESRLNTLESTLGIPTTTPPTSLLDTITNLDKKLSLISSPAAISSLSAQLKSAAADLSRILELRRKALLENLESPTSTTSPSNEKLDHLYGILQNQSHTFSVLPHLVSRLRALQGLHTQVLDVANSVSHISTQQSNAEEDIKHLQSGVNRLEQSVKSNMETILGNCEVVEKRVAELTKRIELLR